MARTKACGASLVFMASLMMKSLLCNSLQAKALYAARSATGLEYEEKDGEPWHNLTNLGAA